MSDAVAVGFHGVQLGVVGAYDVAGAGVEADAAATVTRGAGAALAPPDRVHALQARLATTPRRAARSGRGGTGAMVIHLPTDDAASIHPGGYRLSRFGRAP